MKQVIEAREAGYCICPRARAITEELTVINCENSLKIIVH